MLRHYTLAIPNGCGRGLLGMSKAGCHAYSEPECNCVFHCPSSQLQSKNRSDEQEFPVEAETAPEPAPPGVSMAAVAVASSCGLDLTSTYTTPTAPKNTIINDKKRYSTCSLVKNLYTIKPMTTTSKEIIASGVSGRFARISAICFMRSLNLSNKNMIANRWATATADLRPRLYLGRLPRRVAMRAQVPPARIRRLPAPAYVIRPPGGGWWWCHLLVLEAGIGSASAVDSATAGTSGRRKA